MFFSFIDVVASGPLKTREFVVSMQLDRRARRIQDRKRFI